MDAKAVEQLVSLLSELSAGVQKNAQQISAMEETLRVHSPEMYRAYQEILSNPKRRGYSAGLALSIDKLRQVLTQDHGA
jgi:hypothetical protein